jgi:superoxide dismutase
LLLKGAGQFGSGWRWLVKKAVGSLDVIMTLHKQGFRSTIKFEFV